MDLHYYRTTLEALKAMPGIDSAHTDTPDQLAYNEALADMLAKLNSEQPNYIPVREDHERLEALFRDAKAQFQDLESLSGESLAVQIVSVMRHAMVCYKLPMNAKYHERVGEEFYKFSNRYKLILFNGGELLPSREVLAAD